MNGLKFIFIISAFLLCGCASQTGTIQPSAIPEKRITKTAIPPYSAAESEPEHSDDPWMNCSNILDGEISISSVENLSPEEFRRRVQITFMIQDQDSAMASVALRCMNEKVYACVINGKNQCLEKVSYSTEPNETMKIICADLQTGTLTAKAIGQNSAYDWGCRDGKPAITGLRLETDAAGYDKSIWIEIPKP